MGKRAPTTRKRAGRTMNRATEVGKRTMRDVGSPGMSSGRALLESIRAGCEDGRDVRVRHAQALEIDAPFLTRRSRPTDEKGEAFANKGEPDEIPARFTGQQGGPIALPSSPHDERGEPHTKRAAFPVQPGRLPAQSGRLMTQPDRPTTQQRGFIGALASRAPKRSMGA